MTDCQFERKVCDMFRPNTTPFILVFKKDKVYKVKFMKTTISSEDILDMLSADNFI